MRRYWQRRPICLRAALPDIASLIAPRELFDLASQPDVESRLIERSDNRWQLKHGPFNRLPARRRPDWTLLVQGVDLHHHGAHELLQRFRFIPDARLDDLMVSFATDGGGVGPHVDSYDVFLLQGRGRRRWRIAPPGDTTLVADAPVKLLAHFAPTEEWLLEAGDMLYLPPGWGHDGVAEGDCMTLSIGFRAPSRQEFLQAFLAAASDTPGGADPRFSDRGQAATDTPAELPANLVNQLSQWAQSWRPRQADIEQFIGSFLTEPKPTVWFESPAHPMALDRFQAVAARQGVRLARATRMAWRGPRVFINGEALRLSTPARRWLQQLAQSRVLTAEACGDALTEPALAALLHAWYQTGWLNLEHTDGNAASA